MSIDTRADPPATSIVSNGLPQPRFAWNRDEVAGAVGDLGTFLPHIIGAITVAGMAPTGIFTSFGLFYLLAGTFYVTIESQLRGARFRGTVGVARRHRFAT